MEFTVTENVPGMLIFINFQKAIDSLELDFIFGCVEAFNFGPDFGRWVETFYKNIQSCVINNGNVSDYFFLGRGVRQGDMTAALSDITSAQELFNLHDSFRILNGLKQKVCGLGPLDPTRQNHLILTGLMSR